VISYTEIRTGSVDVGFLFLFPVRVELVETIFIPGALKSPSTEAQGERMGEKDGKKAALMCAFLSFPRSR